MSTTDELIHASAIVEDHICEQEQRGEKMGSSRELLAQNAVSRLSSEA